MKEIIKPLLVFSIMLNFALAAVLFWGYSQVKTAHEELVYTEVSENLIALNSSISTEKSNSWADPVKVASRMSELLSGLALVSNYGTSLGFASGREARILSSLFTELGAYPNGDFLIQQPRTLSEGEQQTFEELGLKLTDAGFGMRASSPDEWDVLMQQLADLEQLLLENK